MPSFSIILVNALISICLSLIINFFIKEIGKWIDMLFKKKKWKANIAKFFLLAIILFLLINYSPTFYQKLANLDCSRYGFESDDQIWAITHDQLRGSAMSSVGQSENAFYKGKASMNIRVALKGDPSERAFARDKGEVYVDPEVIPMKRCIFQKRGDIVPGKTVIKARVYIPKSLISDNLSEPLHLQLFIEDNAPSPNRFTDESATKKLISAGWHLIKFAIPENVNGLSKIGIKIGLNDNDHGTYSGEIFIDTVDW